MARCIHCGKEITLKENEINCPNCGLPPYKCWHCNTEITGETKQCSWCGYFRCPNCGYCNPNCVSLKHIENIKNMNIFEIVDYFGDVKNSFDKKKCPNGVPISYAKGKIRNYLLKLKGFHVKNFNDQEQFNKRFKEKIISMPLGHSFTITQLREMGFHGIEIREVCNLGICLGLIKYERKKDKNSGREYDLYTRINGEKCKYFDDEKLIVKKCPKCNKTYPFEQTVCEDPNCKYKRGPKKGQYRILVERISKVDVCQLSRSSFKKSGDNYGI